MEYRKESNTIYLRIDKGEPVIETILRLCVKEGVLGGYFQGIGACDRAVLATWIPAKENFIEHELNGMLEMITLNGNITVNNAGKPTAHSHAVFSYLDENGSPTVMAGHLKDARISYTGEIVLVQAESPIKKKFSKESGIDIWDLRK